MAAAFDPYYKWLGIPPEEQPPNHYRLLAIKLFEGDAEVIEHAADRQMAHLRTLQTGRQGVLSQRLLNEVAAAKLCLLKAEKKAAYDAQLRHVLGAAKSGEDTSSHERLLRELGQIVGEEGLHVSAARASRGSRMGAVVAGAVTLALLGLGAVVWWTAVGRRPSVSSESQLALGAKPRASEPQLALGAKPRATEPPVSAKPSEAQLPRPAPVSMASAQKPERTPTDEPPSKPVVRPPAPTPEPVRAKEKPQPPAEKPQPSRVASAAPTSPLPIPAAPAEAKKLPIPSQAAQDEAMKAAQDLYRADYERAKTPADKQALARKLLQQAASSELSAADRFVLLRLARDVAVRGEDAERAFEAINSAAEGFQIDVLETKAEVLASLAKTAKMQAGHKLTALRALRVAEEALKADRLSIAENVAKLATAEAGKARDKDVVLGARSLSKEIQETAKAFVAVEPARAVLQDRPDDPAANLVLGQYLCFVKGDWDTGLPHLAKGADAQLKSLAERELKCTVPSQRVSAAIAVDLSDGWWGLAESSKGRRREAAILRAAYWCEQVGEVQSAELRRKVRERLRQASVLERTGGRREPPPLVINSIGMKLVLIRPGFFEMGLSSEEITAELGEAQRQSADERVVRCIPAQAPRHLVRITKPIYMGIYEVTQGEYRQVMGANRSVSAAGGRAVNQVAEQNTSRYPVRSVSWNMAAEFCRRLTSLDAEERASRAYRLPTEAEWEYVCRAGSTARWHCGNDEASLSDYAWIHSNSRGGTHPVGEKKPNGWGLHDMHGNLWEWCADWFAPEYYQGAPISDPTGPPTGRLRVTRGGSYATRPAAGTAFRWPATPDDQGAGNGFRVVAFCAHY